MDRKEVHGTPTTSIKVNSTNRRVPSPEPFGAPNPRLGTESRVLLVSTLASLLPRSLPVD